MTKLGPKKEEYEKILLLYSGGLDTSCMIKWLQEKYKAKIYTFTADLGQEFADPSRFEEIEEKAYNLGVVKHYKVDLKTKFVKEYIFPTIKANGLYQGVYPLSTAIGRPLIAIEAIKIAQKEKIEAIAHGCTGKGNDQIRFNVTIRAYDPKIEVLMPLIEWNMGRDDELLYAQKHGIQIKEQNRKYSVDENLFGRSAECDILEHPEIAAPEDCNAWTKSPEDSPDTPESIDIHFEKGIPVKLNNEPMEGVEIIRVLNNLGCKHGIGRVSHMEDRAIGLKSREVYEVPAALILIKAHKDLEKYVCTKHENSFKTAVDQRWTELAYEGLWIDPLRDALEAFINTVNQKVTGQVKLKLFKGKASVIARESPYGLYDLNLATYDTNSTFNQRYSYGFIPLWGLQSEIGFQVKNSMNLSKDALYETQAGVIKLKNIKKN
ncbi:MAG: argininosuccinate synthase [Promethearchaeota archaeon]|jgi:argininosuccinate synthase